MYCNVLFYNIIISQNSTNNRYSGSAAVFTRANIVEKCNMFIIENEVKFLIGLFDRCIGEV